MNIFISLKNYTNKMFCAVHLVVQGWTAFLIVGPGLIEKLSSGPDLLKKVLVGRRTLKSVTQNFKK